MATEKLPNDFFRNFLFLKFSLFWRNDARKTNFSGTVGVLGLPGVLGFRVLGGIHCKQIEDVQSGIVPPKKAQVGGDGIEHLHLGLLGMRLLDCEEQERAIAKWGFGEAAMSSSSSGQQVQLPCAKSSSSISIY